MLKRHRTIAWRLVGLLVMIGLPVACLVVWKSSQDGPPAGVVTPTNQRIVARSSRDKIIATYRVTNRGRRDLVLGDVRTTCGCSVASVQPKILKPGRSGTITIKGDPPRVGAKTVFAHIVTNAPPPGELTIKLTMIGTAPIPYVAVSSGPVRFGIIRPDSPPETIRIETRERSGQTPWLHDARSTLPDIRIRGGLAKERSLGDGVVFRTYRYAAEVLHIPEQPGDVTGEVLFNSDRDCSAPVLRLAVLGTVRPAVYPAPSALYTSLGPDGTMPKLTLTLISDDPQFALETEPASRDDETLDIKQRLNANGRAEFEIISREPLKESLHTTLEFQTNHPGARTVRVPLTLQRTNE